MLMWRSHALAWKQQVPPDDAADDQDQAAEMPSMSISSKDVMSWKRQPDGMGKREAYLRGAQESEARQRPPDPSTRAPRSPVYRARWGVALAIIIVAVWLLR